MGEWEKVSEKGRALRCAESFRHLAEVFQHLPSRKDELSGEDLEEIYDTVRTKVCDSCGKHANCWGWDIHTTTRLAYELLTAVAGEEGANGEPESAQVKAKFFRYCIRGQTFLEELRNSFCRARINLMWSNRMLENRAAVGEQLLETARIMEEIACTMFDEGETSRALKRRIRGRLLLQNVKVKNLRILKNNSGCAEMILTAQSTRGRCVPTRVVADIVSRIWGRSLVPERDSRVTLGHDPDSLRLVEDTRYYMLTGAARTTCAGQAASGDNYSVLVGSHGQVILGISDGMGSGVEANMESQTVIELLEQFLEAGFSAETAVRMINSAMVLQRGMQRFSTLDICGVNLYSGQCEFLKIGAATTFIRRNGWVETVTSTSLPIGVFQEVDFERSKKKLEHGDMIVMVSDGVLDALPREEGEELMRYMIRQLQTENPAEFAHLLLEQVCSFEQEGPRDDMTILAGGFWKK